MPEATIAEATDLTKPSHCSPGAQLRVNNVTVTLRLILALECRHSGGFEEDRIACVVGA